MLTEKSRTSYRTLLEVQVMHRYFLNMGQPDGKILDWAGNSEAAPMQALRQRYDVRRFLRFEAAPDTQALLDQHRLRLQPTREGFGVVGAATYNFDKPDTLLMQPLSDGCSLTFYAYPTDPLFAIYTDIHPNLDARHSTSSSDPPLSLGDHYQLYASGAAWAAGATGFGLFQESSSFDGETSRCYVYDLQQATSAQALGFWAEPGERPLFTVTVQHTLSTPVALHGSQGELLPDSLQCVVQLSHRQTQWYYLTPGQRAIPEKGRDLGSHDLLYYGGVPLEDDLPNPTAATTNYSQSDPKASGQMISFIY